MFFVQRGKVEVSVTSPVFDLIVAGFGNGNHFGETSLMNNTNRTLCIKSITACDIHILRKFDLEDLLNLWETQLTKPLVDMSEIRSDIMDEVYKEAKTYTRSDEFVEDYKKLLREKEIRDLEMKEKFKEKKQTMRQSTNQGKLSMKAFPTQKRYAPILMVNNVKKTRDEWRAMTLYTQNSGSGIEVRDTILKGSAAPCIQSRNKRGNQRVLNSIQKMSRKLGRHISMTPNPNVTFSQFNSEDGIIPDEEQLWALRVIPPNSAPRIKWELFLGVLILYSAITVPVRVGFDIELVDLYNWARIFDLTVDLLFCLDMIFNFRVAYYDDYDCLVFEPKQIARRYLQTWFLVDFPTSVPFDHIFALFFSSEDDSARFASFKLIRLVKSFKLLKLARVLKLGKSLEVFEDKVTVNPAVVRMVKLFLKILYLAHILSCFWVMVTNYNEEDNDWIQQQSGGDRTTTYIIAMYWTHSTLTTVGYGDVYPVSRAEKAYTVLAMIIGAIVFGYIIGSMAALVHKIDKSSIFREKLDIVKEYMRERKLSFALRTKVKQYFEHLFTIHTNFDENEILTDLPDCIRDEVVLFLNRDIVSKIPFFDSSDDSFIAFVVSLMRPQFCIPEDFIFMEGDLGTEMYFLVKGCVDIVGSAGTPDETVYQTLYEGTYFGELAVLFHCRRTASVRACTYCSIFSLSRKDLDSVMDSYPLMAEKMTHALEKTRRDMDKGKMYLAPKHRETLSARAFKEIAALDVGKRARSRVPEPETDVFAMPTSFII